MSSIEVIDRIKSLARTIHAETGRYVAYSEHMQGRVECVVTICTGHDGERYTFDRFAGSDAPLPDQQTLSEMHEGLLMWLVNYRKEEAA